MSDDYSTKLPLGAAPRELWLNARARELSGAIHAYIDQGYLGGPKSHHIERWVAELSEVMALLSERPNNQQTEGT